MMIRGMIFHAVWLSAVASIVSGEDPELVTACDNIQERASLARLTRCQYAQRYCYKQTNLVDYYSMYYCVSPAVTVSVMAIFSIAVLSLLSSTANEFLVPVLRHICSVLKLSPNVAGVTLLAFGNSAPDIITSIAGLELADVPLVLSSLVGAGLCITTLCLGLVLYIARPKIDNPIWLLRDLVTYLTATVLIIVVCQTHALTLWHGLAFISLYILYAGSVVYSFAFDSIPTKIVSLDSINDGMSDKLLQVGDCKISTNENISSLYDFGPEYRQAFDCVCEPSLSSPDSSLTGLLKWRHTLEHPFTVLRSITIPKLSGEFNEAERQRLVLAPTIISALFSVAFLNSSLTSLPYYMIVAGSLSSGAALRFLPHSERPQPTLLLAFIGFISAIAWLSLFASEMVVVIQAIGVFCNISSAALGLTILATASSFGDLITNVTIARHGGASSAISACFGAPIMNDLFGLGLALTVTCLRTHPIPLRLAIHTHVTMGWAFLIISLIVSILGFTLTNFHPGRSFGLFLIAIYALFIVTTVIFTL